MLQQQSLHEQDRVLFGIAVGINFGTVLNARRTIHDRPYINTPFRLYCWSFHSSDFTRLSSILSQRAFCSPRYFVRHSVVYTVSAHAMRYSVYGVCCMSYIVFLHRIGKKAAFSHSCSACSCAFIFASIGAFRCACDSDGRGIPNGTLKDFNAFLIQRIARFAACRTQAMSLDRLTQLAFICV